MWQRGEEAAGDSDRGAVDASVGRQHGVARDQRRGGGASENPPPEEAADEAAAWFRSLLDAEDVASIRRTQHLMKPLEYFLHAVEEIKVMASLDFKVEDTNCVLIGSSGERE